MKNILILAVVGLALFIGSKEVLEAPETPEVPVMSIMPLYDHLIAAPQNWKDAYGDTLEARMIYNLAVLRNNQLEIAKMIQLMHPPVEPNVPQIAKFDRSIIKKNGERKMLWEQDEDVMNKLDEIVDWINKSK